MQGGCRERGGPDEPDPVLCLWVLVLQLEEARWVEEVQASEKAAQACWAASEQAQAGWAASEQAQACWAASEQAQACWAASEQAQACWAASEQAAARAQSPWFVLFF